jgi:1-deoxy-D-xylulose-5-phosphate synthase
MDVIGEVVGRCPGVVLAEDHSVAGGFGSAVLEALAEAGIDAGHVRQAGVPQDWVRHASRESQLAGLELDATGLARRLRRLLDR